ncbi:MAG TPA: patatin-like phospholipase family protein [Terriglobales bacterium]|nr:patatin-like phospholipase family protein [Terriglobales bacterium]
MLQDERTRFRASLPADIATIWKRFPGRIAAVLSGGGARGAYEAGVLLAFQDARLPTHILTSTSIGAINAASYASHTRNYVGNAEPLVEGWLDLSPSTVGIDWSRYIIVIAGLIAASAGFGNLIIDLLRRFGVSVREENPLLTWSLLAAAGLAVLFSYTELSYCFYVATKLLRGSRWRPEPSKLLWSLVANAIVLAFLLWILLSTHLTFNAQEIYRFEPKTELWMGVAALGLVLIWWLFRNHISRLSQKIVKSPLDTGLFQNYERTRFLKARIDQRRLRRSKIRVVMTAADLYSGQLKFFVNKPVSELERDPGVDAEFIRANFENNRDLIQAVIASSAFPIAYEPVKMENGLWSDGGLVSKEPVLPAIRLGADVLFLISVDPAQEVIPKIKNFLDVGMRAFDILMARNVKAELRLLETVNQICENYAAKLGARPEQVRLEIGDRNYRYLKAFTIRPAVPLRATLLDFEGEVARSAIEQGYKDAAQTVLDFLQYIERAPAPELKYVLRLESEEISDAGILK